MIKDDVYLFLTKIPKGKVVTYKQIAEAVGCPRAARAVGNILHRNPDPDGFPCFKAVNASGRIADNFGFGGGAEQIRRLRADGIEVTDNKVDLKKYQWENN